MPTTAADSREFRELIRFTASAPYELLLSLGTVHWQPPRHAAWAAAARAALGPDLLAEAAFFYGELWHPLVLMELPVDYSGPADRVKPFLEYVAAMDPDTFLFYMWGRIIPRDEIAALRADPDAVRARIHDFYEFDLAGQRRHAHAGQGADRDRRGSRGLAATPAGAAARLCYARLHATAARAAPGVGREP